MKDSEFIELLNLYLDHEIAASDAARLEAEVQRSPERRRVYQEYCRIQKACTLLARDFNHQAADTEVVGNSEAELERPGRVSWRPGVLGTAGLFAAAACVAFVFVANRKAPSPSLGRPVSVMPAAHSVGAPVTAAVETGVLFGPGENIATKLSFARTVTVPAARRSELPLGLALGSLALGKSLATAEASSEGALAAQFDWINNLQIAPMRGMQVDDFRFEARPLEAAKDSIYGGRNRPARQGVVEMTAFQFQK